MFKYYLSKDYRKAYDELDKTSLLSDSLAIKFSTYETTARELLLSNGCINRHLQILTNDKPTPVKIIKGLLFLHAWLQTTPALPTLHPLQAFMDHILKAADELGKKAKSDRESFERKRAKSAIFKADYVSGEEIEMTKQVFLLEKVIRPYVLYLQKLVSVFPFYNSLKKTLYRTLPTAEIWILLNLFKCGYAVTMQLPTICKFIRKSFNPVAEGIAEAFSCDFNNFYPKLSHYIHDQCFRIEAQFDELQRKVGEVEAYRTGIDGLEEAVNFLQDIEQLNGQLESVYNQSALRSRINICRPKFISLSDPLFEFITYVHHIKTSNAFGEQTPKFYRTHSSRPSEQTESDKTEPRAELVPVFKDVTNEEDNVCTFRKEKQTHLVARYRKRQECENE